jgi:hypothetical protein
VTEFSQPPIFIVGSPRSGTSLLRNLLSRHPRIGISNETRFFADIYKRRSAFGPLDKIENRKRLVDQYLSTARVQWLEVDLDGLRQRLLERATSYREFLATVMQYHIDSHHKQRCGEKTPHHALHTELLSEWFPSAYIIHLVRDPRDVVASLQRMAWAHKSVVNNALIWLLFNRGAERSRHRPQYLLVHYEDLAGAPELELARICQHIGETWPDDIPVAAEDPEPYAWPMSIHRKVTRDRVQKWKSQLTPKEVALVEEVAGARLEKYGYERSGPRASIPTLIQGVAGAGYDLAREGARQLPHAWYFLTRPRNLVLHEHTKYGHAWDSMFPGLSPHEREK